MKRDSRRGLVGIEMRFDCFAYVLLKLGEAIRLSCNAARFRFVPYGDEESGFLAAVYLEGDFAHALNIPRRAVRVNGATESYPSTVISRRTPRMSISYSISSTGGRAKCQRTPCLPASCKLG